MALYKVYESASPVYRLQPPGGYVGFSYDDVILAGDYKDSLPRGGFVANIWAMRKEVNETPTAHTTVYMFYATGSVDWPSWHLAMSAFDGQTGQHLWSDYSTYAGIFFSMALRDVWWQDTDDISWSHHTWGYSYRHPNRTESENNQAGQAGLPHYNIAELVIDDSEWLDPDGNAYTGGDAVLKYMLAICPKENRSLQIRGGDRTKLIVYNYTTRKELFRVQCTPEIQRGIVVDNEIFYGVTKSGLVNVVNYKTGQHGGILALGETFRAYRYVTLGYDPVYRRFIVYREEPDDPVTGACNSILEGYRLQEVPVHLTSPIPLKAPRKNRVVPVHSKVVGESGKGIPGLQVAASLTGSNAIAPNVLTSDAKGKVIFQWDTAISGVDVDQIDLSVDYETQTPGLDPPSSATQMGSAPANTESTTYFQPGWWLYSPMSNDTPATKWDSLLSSYTDNDDIPFQGVLQEYKWTDFENSSPGVFDWTKVTNDVNYLTAKGMKLIVSIQLCSESNSDFWIPDDIRDDVTVYPNQVYPQSMDPISYFIGRGMFNLALTNTSGEGFCPIIFVESVHARLRALFTGLNAAFAGNADVVGYAVGDSRYNRDDVSDAAVPADETFYEARLRLLDHLNSITSKMVWEFCQVEQFSHARNCMNAGHNVGAYKLHLDGDYALNVRYAIKNYGSGVSTGFIADQDCYTRTQNLLCTTGNPPTTAFEKAFGGPDVQGCDLDFMDEYKALFVFWYPNATYWTGTEEIQETCEQYQLTAAKLYWGS